MMIAAFVGVIGWSFLGFAGSDGIFPSVPGMGAAFIAHFVMLASKKDPWLMEKIPNRDVLITIIGIIIAVIVSIELWYIYA